MYTQFKGRYGSRPAQRKTPNDGGKNEQSGHHTVDEEGKLKEIKGGFTFLGWGTVIAGTGIVLGGNSSRLKALQENLASFEMMTEWVDAADVPPPHAFVTAF